MSDMYNEPPHKRPCTEQGSTGSHQTSSGSAADANVTLWQFLLDLLLKQQFSNIICWTNNDGEFKLLDAEQVAKLWGLKKNKNNMNYDKLSRALRYYYDKNIIKKVMGQKFVYKFVSFPEMVKTENRIPFKKKMESIVNDSNPSYPSNIPSSVASSFQTFRPYDVKSGIIQQAQAAQLAVQTQLQAMQRAKLAATISEEHRRLTEQRDHLAVDSTYFHVKTEALSPGLTSRAGQTMFPQAELEESESSFSDPNTPNSNISPQNGGLTSVQSAPGNLSACQTMPTDLSIRRPSPEGSPLDVCTPDSSPHGPVFDMSGSNTPTPPPQSSLLPNKESDMKIRLELPELNSSEKFHNDKVVSEQNTTKTPALKHQRSKPDPLSISNDEPTPDPIVNSPLAQRNMLPSLNTPMFLTSPLFSSRTPFLPGLGFWPGTLSPILTLSPRLPGGLQAPNAFQFPSFAVSPASLATFSHFNDNVFTNSGRATPTTSQSANDKKVFTS